MNEAELAGRTARLPELFADRLPAGDLAGLRSMAGGGEWDELLDLLIAALRVTAAPISVQERDQLRAVLTDWGLPSEQLDDLVVRGS
jgi:hypothetical protein